MADKKDLLSVHNPQLEAESDDIQENADRRRTNTDKDKDTEAISLSSSKDNEEEAADSLSPILRE